MITYNFVKLFKIGKNVLGAMETKHKDIYYLVQKRLR